MFLVSTEHLILLPSQSAGSILHWKSEAITTLDVRTYAWVGDYGPLKPENCRYVF